MTHAHNTEKPKERSYMSGNLQKLLFDFISVHEEQGRLLDKSMENTRQAMTQTDRAIENTNRVLAELAEQRKQMDRIISILLNISPN